MAAKWPDFLDGILPRMSTVFQMSVLRRGKVVAGLAALTASSLEAQGLRPDSHCDQHVQPSTEAVLRCS